jgi:hypothetical protein
MTETKQATHTPTPWETEISVSNYGLLGIRKANGSKLGICSVIGADGAHNPRYGISADEAKANAAFIVRAVNSHDDLLAACKELLRLSEISDEEWAPQIKANNSARAAIAKATA